MDYRERLKAVREDRDLTQCEVGKVINKSQQGYNHIEMGRAELRSTIGKRRQRRSLLRSIKQKRKREMSSTRTPWRKN
ncbi:helix-turn-helix domain-containing protein [Ruminococcus sp.]|uniref:helix-turn-helix domain-containing protein n=1 Tax=Ruminococcus sp. TaxID=41978 RepID=UPI00388E9BA1